MSKAIRYTILGGGKVIHLEIKKPKRITRRINLLTDEGTILFGALFSFGMVIGIALYYAVISPFLR
jgi:hypothetical protein